MLEAPTHPSPSTLLQTNGGHHAHPLPPDASQENQDASSAPDHSGNQSSLTAAADLIRTLDTAFAEMSTLSASAARDAEDARRNARAASEVARRYTARSYTTGSGSSSGGSSEDVFRQNRSIVAELQSLTTNRNGSKDDKTSITLSHALVPLDENGEMALDTTGRKRKTMTVSAHNKTSAVPSSSERLAQSHAEDVLSLSLELERTKQALETEQRKHDETRAALTEARCQTTQLDSQVQKLLNDRETQLEDNGRTVDGLQQELKRAQVRVDAAEEDAQLALDLAKGNADSREHVEEWLQRALQEVQLLRERLEHVGVDPKNVMSSSYPRGRRNQSVRFADSPTILSPEPIVEEDQSDFDFGETPRSQASRPMVAAGRHLLQRAKPISTSDAEERCHSVSFTPELSAKRRSKLRERLQSMTDGDSSPSPVRLDTPRGAGHGIDMGLAAKAMETTRKVSKYLVESGNKLGLVGLWWGKSSPMSTSDDHLENMTRQYCYSVEAKIGKQTEQLKELGALCDYLEQRLVVEDGCTIKTDSTALESNGTV